MTAQSILPAGWPRPRGYSNGMTATGRVLAVAGQVAWDENESIVSPDFVRQFERALANVLSVVRAAGGTAESIISLTIYVTDRREYLSAGKEVGAVYREVMGRHYPAMALVEVAGLIEDGARIEIQGLAIL